MLMETVQNKLDGETFSYYDAAFQHAIYPETFSSYIINLSDIGNI
jgi:hypothetical protein